MKWTLEDMHDFLMRLNMIQTSKRKCSQTFIKLLSMLLSNHEIAELELVIFLLNVLAR
jgi:hypothetical protein